VLLVCLGNSSMRLEGPFIAPRGLGAVGAPFGRPLLPSIHGAPDTTQCNGYVSPNWLISSSRGTGLPDAPVDHWLWPTCQLAVGQLAHRGVQRSMRTVQ
jgi:hypothetical protein